MTRLILTSRQMIGLMTQHRDALGGKMRFLDIVMPNGKTLANCTGDYVWQVGIAMQEYACESSPGGAIGVKRQPKPIRDRARAV
jgi:hypothetical protein